MAILKDVELNTGVKVNYWNISAYTINYLKDDGFSGTISVQGYLNKVARISGKLPIQTREYAIDKYLQDNEKMIKSLYSYLKTLGDFLEAVDD